MGAKFSNMLDLKQQVQNLKNCYENSEIKTYLDNLKKRYNKKFMKIKELSDNLKKTDYSTNAKISKLKKEIL